MNCQKEEGKGSQENPDNNIHCRSYTCSPTSKWIKFEHHNNKGKNASLSLSCKNFLLPLYSQKGNSSKLIACVLCLSLSLEWERVSINLEKQLILLLKVFSSLPILLQAFYRIHALQTRKNLATRYSTNDAQQECGELSFLAFALRSSSSTNRI